jgi:tetratricopeptide (TPR) repeat protein
MRGLLWVCGGAVVIHLLPLLLPRNVPERDLAIARAIPEATGRVEVLRRVKENPKVTAAHLREAATLLLGGAPSDARELAEEAARREPDSVETQLVLAAACHEEGSNRCEEQAFARVAALAPGDARADLLRADFREREGDEARALESVEWAYRKRPGDVAVGVRYSRLLSAVGRGDEAVTVLRGLEGKLGQARGLLEVGRVRAEQGRLGEARALFAKVVELEPRSAQAHYHLGMTAWRQGDVEWAEEALREADRLDMTDLRPLSALCAIQRHEGRSEAALATRMDLERRFPERLEEVRGACRAGGP